MKLLLDQGLPQGAVPILIGKGIDSAHLYDLNLSQTKDEILLDYAISNAFTIVALDADFHAILALSGAEKPSVVRIRIEGLKAQALADLLERVLSVAAKDLERGAVVTVQEGCIRIRRLPILGLNS